MLSQLSWPWRYAVMIGVGTVFGLFTLKIVFRPRLLRVLGALPYLSPNWLTLWRAPIVAIGSVIYLTAHDNATALWTGFLMVVFGLVLDRVDGKEAENLIKRLRYLPALINFRGDVSGIYNFDSKDKGPVAKPGQLWAHFSKEEKDDQGNTRLVDRLVLVEEWLVRLTRTYTRIPMFQLSKDLTTSPESLRLTLTGMGEWLDPLIDKVNFHPLFIYLAVNNLASTPLVVLVIAVDLFSTVMRHPFDRVRPFNRLQRFVRVAKASPFGKTKMIWQILSMLSVMPVISGWLNAAEREKFWYVTSTLLAIGVLAGVLSVVSRLTLMDSLLKLPGLRRFNKNLKEV